MAKSVYRKPGRYFTVAKLDGEIYFVSQYTGELHDATVKGFIGAIKSLLV